MRINQFLLSVLPRFGTFQFCSDANAVVTANVVKSCRRIVIVKGRLPRCSIFFFVHLIRPIWIYLIVRISARSARSFFQKWTYYI